MSASGSIGTNPTSLSQPSYSNSRLSSNEAIKNNFNASAFLPSSELELPLNNVFQQNLNQMGFNGAKGSDGSQTKQGFEGIQLAKGPVTNARPGGRVSATTSYTQPITNNSANNLIREIQTVRPSYRYNIAAPITAAAGLVGGVVVAYNQNDVNTLTGVRDKIRADLLAQLPQSEANSVFVQNMTLANLNNKVEQTQFRTYQANGGKASFQEWSVEKPISAKESTLKSDQSAIGSHVPQGFSEPQFENLSLLVREKAAILGLGNDIFVQGSRAGGTAKPNSDIDIAIRLPPAQFNDFLHNQSKLSNVNPGSAKERTLLHAIDTGKIQSGEAGLSSLRKQLEKTFGMEVDLSIIKAGGKFDNAPRLPLLK